MDEKFTYISTWQTMNMFHDLPKYVLGPPPNGRLDANSGTPCQS